MTGYLVTEEQRFQMTVSVHLVLLLGDQILLLRRFQTGYDDGSYGLVSGCVDGDETATQAMIREAKEEAGIILNSENIECSCVMHVKRPESEWMSLFFIARRWEGEIYNGEPEKCDDIRFFPLNELPENTVPYVKEGIEKSLQADGSFFTEYGWKG